MNMIKLSPFIRFLLIGILNTIIGITMMSLFFHVFELSYWGSTFLGNSIGAIVSYFLNRFFTFKSKVALGSSAIRFVIVILLCYVISYRVSELFVQQILEKITLMSPVFRNDIAMYLGMVIYTVLNFWGQKIFVFRHSKVGNNIILTENK